MKSKRLTVLVGCEESQTITKAFRELGVEAYSCDLLPCSGGHPEWHFRADVFEVIGANAIGYPIKTQGGDYVTPNKFDIGIFHPPCTYLTVSGNRWMKNKDGSPNQERIQAREDALSFVQALMDCGIPYISIENPVGVISTRIRKPDQIVQPYHFGDPARKTTCLWLKGLPQLAHTNVVDEGESFEWVDKKGRKKRQPMWYYQAFCDAKTPEERRTIRSKTFQGMANAMAFQWTLYMLNKKYNTI